MPQLRFEKATRVFTEMRDNDTTVGAILFAIEMLLRQVDWDVEPDPDDPAGDARAEFLEECMEDMSHSWSDFIAECLSFLVFGWSFHEIVYKYRRGPDADPASKFTDGKLGWRKFPIRAQDTRLRWEFDENGGVQGL